MFDIVIGILGAIQHPVATVRSWWETLREPEILPPASGSPGPESDK
jgi:hypothetical protein